MQDIVFDGTLAIMCHTVLYYGKNFSKIIMNKNNFTLCKVSPSHNPRLIPFNGLRKKNSDIDSVVTIAILNSNVLGLL